MLEFDEERHLYRLDGIEVPSVTQLLEPLSKKVYGDVPLTAMMAAAARGTAVHEAIAEYWEYGMAMPLNGQSGYFDAFMAWRKSHQIELYGSEMRVYNRGLQYAGTLDMWAKVDGVGTIIDFKTSSRIEEMLYRVQLEAYLRALESMDTVNVGKVSELCVLQLRNDGSYVEKYYAPDNSVWSVFLSLISINNYAKKHGY